MFEVYVWMQASVNIFLNQTCILCRGLVMAVKLYKSILRSILRQISRSQ